MIKNSVEFSLRKFSELKNRISSQREIDELNVKIKY